MSSPLIMLDCDGVLNAHAAYPNGYCGTEWRCVEHLNRILSEVPVARIVVSSAWRYLILNGYMTDRGFENMMLTHGLDCRGRIIGHTCSDETFATRGAQIRNFLNACDIRTRHVILDDGGQNPDGTFDDMGIGRFNLKVVWTDGKVGLTEADADRAIAILNGKASG